MNIDDWVKGTEAFLADRVHDSWRQEFVNAALDAGLPTRKTEEWRYTQIEPLFGKGLALNGDSGQVSTSFDALEGYRIITRNGALVSSDDLPAGVSVSNISEAGGPFDSFKGDPLTALAAATYSEGILIRIESNTSLENPIILVDQTDLKGGQTVAARYRLKLVLERRRR